MKSYKRRNLFKKILFTILLFVLSPILIPFVIIGTILAILYLPVDHLRYNKYKELGDYYPLFTVINRKEIKNIKLNKKHQDY